MITLFTRTVCPKCMGVKNRLNAEGIGFEAINIDLEENAQHAERLRESNFMSVPVLEVDGVLHGDLTKINGVIDEIAE